MHRSSVGWGLKGALFALSLGLFATPASAFRTPFGDEVNAAIQRGLAWIRTQENNGSYNAQATALGALAILEERTSADWNAPTRGYRNASADDQARLRRMARYVIDNDRALRGAELEYSYETGSNLLFLSLFVSTGGPQNVDAAVSVPDAIRSGANALAERQGEGGCNSGGWNYNQPEGSGDLSTTQYAMAGLSAASGLVAGAAEPLPLVTPFLEDATNADGGLAYRSCGNWRSASSMTAAGVWSYRLAGVAGNDPRVQSAMSWLQENYLYDDHIRPHFAQSYYYYLWAASKAFEVMGDPGGEGIWEDQVGGVRDPEADGYAAEPRGWYYDFAHQLLQLQGDQGAWPCAVNGSNMCWRQHAATAYAILVLERSLGGVCTLSTW